MYTLPDETDLYWLFESDPDLFEKGQILAYNILTYRTVRGEDEVVCSLSPAYGDVDVWWSRNGTELARVTLQGVSELRVVRFGKSEALEVFSEITQVLPFRLQLKPIVHLSFGTEDQTGATS